MPRREGVDVHNLKIVSEQPTIFLAGPIRNAPEWRDDAIAQMVTKNADVFIASPAWNLRQNLQSHLVAGSSTGAFPRQRAWEQYYLNAAAQNGGILFYLPGEDSTKKHPGKIYAHITMMELGEWIARYEQNPKINLVIATDGNFPEWSTIEFELKSAGITSLYQTLEEGIDAVIGS